MNDLQKNMRKRDRLTITLRNDVLAKVDHYIADGGARNRSQAIEMILEQGLGAASVHRAIILGGGSGMKLQGIDHMTSPLLVRYKGQPLIIHHINRLKGVGVDEIILAVGEFGEDVRAVVGDGSGFGVRLIYTSENAGTASVLRDVQSMLSETFIMFNGHVVVEDVDFDAMITAHKDHKALATMALTSVADPEGFGQIVMRGSRVVRYVEKPSKDDMVSHIINAGIYIMEPEVCGLVESEERSLERDVFPALVDEGDLSGYMLDVLWRRARDL